MSRISAHGISADVPSGWDGRIFQRDDQLSRPIVHLANFSLPVERGDFGSGAVEKMEPDHVLLCLLEEQPELAGSTLFSRTRLPRFRSNHFSPNQMQRTVAGLSGAQAFFTVSGRPFCAYAVLGSHRARGVLVSKVNQLLDGLEISPR